VDREVAHARVAGGDAAARASRNEDRAALGNVMGHAVDDHRAVAVEHDDEHVELAVDVLGELMTGGPGQQRRIEVLARHAP
jgi:hypothetical protein